MNNENQTPQQAAGPAADQAQRCDKCGASLVALNTPHCERKCAECGKTAYVIEPGEDGKGIRVRGGDKFVIPAGYIRMSLNRECTSGVFTRHGIGYFVHVLFSMGSPKRAEEVESSLANYTKEAEAVLESSALLKHLDLEAEAGVVQAFELLKQHQDSREWWAALLWLCAGAARQSIAKNDARQTAYAMANLGISRAMLIFKQSLEETIWRGYAIQQLREVLKVWEANKTNSDEEFWQRTLASNTLILSQLFAHPLVVLQGKAYVGGKGIDNHGGGVLDFLVGNPLSDNTALVEIKTPTTRLLQGSEYRSGVYPPSTELSGAVTQVLRYKDTLSKDFYAMRVKSEQKFDSFNPHCLVIAGHYKAEITPDKLASFELYRRSLRDVQVVTYDEMFGKVAQLVELLGM